MAQLAVEKSKSTPKTKPQTAWQVSSLQRFKPHNFTPRSHRRSTSANTPYMPQKISKSTSTYKVKFVARRDPKYYPVLFYIYALILVPYLSWRLTVVNWQVWYGPVIYLAEFYGAISTVLFLWMAQKIYDPIHRPNTSERTVDALIPTYNEPVEIVEATAIGAKQVLGINQVLILDDGNRAEIKLMAERLGVGYYPRTTNEHAKAGNMNNGLKYSQADFLLTLDADHIPLPNFLERTLGYFDDPTLAFVQTPQTFYNYDSFLFRQTRNGLWSEQTMFYNCIQPSKNRWNSAFFVGTSAVLRRSAIDSVGGFATGTATEDIHTSLKLHARGWSSIFVSEPLAYGIESSSLKEFYKQRRRWSAGSLGLLLRSSDSPLKARGLTLVQRLNYISATIAHLQGVQKLLYFGISAICAFTLVGPVTTNMAAFNFIFVGYLAIAIGFTAAYSRGTYHLLYTEAYSLANMMAHIGGLKGIIRVQRKFAVSHKQPWRRERTLLKPVYWTLLFFGLAAIVRDLYLLYFGTSKLILTLSSLIFTDVNLIFLISFFAYLLAYERGDSVSSSKPGWAAIAKFQNLQTSFSPVISSHRGSTFSTTTKSR